MPPVSLLAAGVATAAAWLLGSIWYGPLFGKAWMAEHGFKLEEISKDFNPAKVYGSMLVLSAVAAYVFGMFIGPEPGLNQALWVGFSVGTFFVAGAIGTNYLFERKSMRLFLIDGGYHTVRFSLIGLAYGLLG